VGGIGDVLHPSCGLLSEVTDETAFFTNLAQACRHFDEYSSQAESGTDWALSKFGYRRLVGDMAALYDKLLKQHGF